MKIRGIIPPLVTPLNSDGSLDFNGTKKLLEHIITGGVHGVFILGTTGEGPSLSQNLRREFIDFVTENTSGRIPVIVSISDTALNESLALAEHSLKAGANAVAFTPPYYFTMGGPEIGDYIRTMSDNLSLPFFLYNMPALTKISIPLNVIEYAFSLENCLGLKDSSGDLHYFKKVNSLIGEKDLTLLMGPEEILAESILAGGNGGVNGGANLYPEIYVKIFECMNRGDTGEAVRLQRHVLDISSSLFTLGNYGSSIIKGIKGALEKKGICKRHLALPFRGFDAQEQMMLSQIVERLDGFR